MPRESSLVLATDLEVQHAKPHERHVRGAVCAVLVWHALERGDHQPWRQLMDFWQDNSAKGWAEIAFNQLLVDSVRMINSGLLPTFQLSPASAVAQSLMQFTTMGLRENSRVSRHCSRPMPP